MHVKIVIKNPETGNFEEVVLLVDTGSTFTWIDRRTLERLGIKRRRLRTFGTIDGRLVERMVGVATIAYEPYEGDVEVIFAEEGMRKFMAALESLEVDLTGRLRYVDRLAV